MGNEWARGLERLATECYGIVVIGKERMTNKLTYEEATHLVDVYGGQNKAAEKTKFSRRQIMEAINRGPEKPLTANDIRDAMKSALDSLEPLAPVPDYIQTTKVAEMGFTTPQDGVLMFSDLHYGSDIDPRTTAGLAFYNQDIADERLRRWRDLVLRFTQQDAALIPLGTLHIFALGDDMEGHGDMFPTQAFGMTEAVGFVGPKFVRRIGEVLPTLLSRWKHVIVYKTRGNHGRIHASAKQDYPPDNLELLAWQSIANLVAQQTGGGWVSGPNGVDSLIGGQIDFHIYPSFAAFVEIMGKTFAFRHGDGIKGIASTYTGLVDNKLRMNAIIGEVINYYLIAHHHEAQSIENEIGGESMVNGCFVGPSLLSVRMQRPAASIPSQEFFLLHPGHGITNRHRLRLATADEMRSLINWTGRLDV
jgi:hypothetical protein